MILIYVVAVLRSRVNCKLKLPPKTTNYTVYLITKPIISYYKKKTVNSNSKKEVKLQLDTRYYFCCPTLLRLAPRLRLRALALRAVQRRATSICHP